MLIYKRCPNLILTIFVGLYETSMPALDINRRARCILCRPSDSNHPFCHSNQQSTIEGGYYQLDLARLINKCSSRRALRGRLLRCAPGSPTSVRGQIFGLADIMALFTLSQTAVWLRSAEF